MKHITALIVALLALATANGSTRELPLPDVPADLTVPAERCDYIMLHFWDKMNFADSAAVADEEFMAMNFATFATLHGHGTDEGVQAATDKLAQTASAYPQAAEVISDLAEQYLIGYDSPVRSDRMYLAMAKSMLAAGFPNQVRIEWLSEVAGKNLPGTEAPDFTFVDRNGNERRLSEVLNPDKLTLLLFYNPDCHNCTDLIRQIEYDYSVSKAITEGRMQVVAICPEGERDEWEMIKKIPAGWVDGFDTSSIMDEETYIIPQIPCMYLIDKEGRIEAKDANMMRICMAAEFSGENAL